MLLLRSRHLATVGVIVLVSLGSFITALDQTVVVTALPLMMVDLGVSVNQIDRASWIIISYLLGYTVVMPLVGRMSDVYGHVRVYQVALIVFAIGSVLVALSVTLGWVVSARVIQAVGGGATVPVGMAIATLALPARFRGLSLGIVAGAAEAGSMLGPVYGAAILEISDWRWIFWLNVPQALILLLLSMFLPKFVSNHGRVDYLGAILTVTALTLLTLGLSQKALFVGFDLIGFCLILVAIIFILILVVHQRSSDHPLVPAFLFRSMTFVSANTAQVLVGASLILAMVTIPLMANTVMGQDPTTGALWLLRMTIFIPIGAVVGGILLIWIQTRWVMLGGLLIGSVGLFLMATWNLDVTNIELTTHLVISGFGYGVVISPILTAALSAAHNDYWATAASWVVVMRMLGMTLGLSALSAWGVSSFEMATSEIPFPMPEIGQSVREFERLLSDYSGQVKVAGLAIFHSFFKFAAICLVIALVPTLFISKPNEDS